MQSYFMQPQNTFSPPTPRNSSAPKRPFLARPFPSQAVSRFRKIVFSRSKVLDGLTLAAEGPDVPRYSGCFGNTPSIESKQNEHVFKKNNYGSNGERTYYT